MNIRRFLFFSLLFLFSGCGSILPGISSPEERRSVAHPRETFRSECDLCRPLVVSPNGFLSSVRFAIVPVCLRF